MINIIIIKVPSRVMSKRQNLLTKKKKTKFEKLTSVSPLKRHSFTLICLSRRTKQEKYTEKRKHLCWVKVKKKRLLCWDTGE